MRNRKLVVIFGILVICISLWNGLVMANDVTSFALVWNVTASGGQPTAGQRVMLNGTIGQPVVGMSAAPRFAVNAGYWQVRPRDTAGAPAAPTNTAIYVPLVVHPAGIR